MKRSQKVFRHFQYGHAIETPPVEKHERSCKNEPSQYLTNLFGIGNNPLQNTNSVEAQRMIKELEKAKIEEEESRQNTEEVEESIGYEESIINLPKNVISDEEADGIFKKLTKELPETKHNTKNWAPEEMKLLDWAIHACLKSNNDCQIPKSKLDWEKIASLIPGRTSKQCHYKYSLSQKPAMSKVPWKADEDKALFQIMNEFPFKNWKSVAIELKSRIPHCSRLPKQCRERWNNHLDPKVKKDQWNELEDIKLLENQKRLGNRWSKIAALIPGRPENVVKNRFYNLEKRMKEEIMKKNEGKHSDIQSALSSLYGSNTNQSNSWIDVLIARRRQQYQNRTNRCFEEVANMLEEELKLDKQLSSESISKSPSLRQLKNGSAKSVSSDTSEHTNNSGNSNHSNPNQNQLENAAEKRNSSGAISASAFVPPAHKEPTNSQFRVEMPSFLKNNQSTNATSISLNNGRIIHQFNPPIQSQPNGEKMKDDLPTYPKEINMNNSATTCMRDEKEGKLTEKSYRQKSSKILSDLIDFDIKETKEKKFPSMTDTKKVIDNASSSSPSLSQTSEGKKEIIENSERFVNQETGQVLYISERGIFTFNENNHMKELSSVDQIKQSVVPKQTETSYINICQNPMLQGQQQYIFNPQQSPQLFGPIQASPQLFHPFSNLPSPQLFAGTIPQSPPIYGNMQLQSPQLFLNRSPLFNINQRNRLSHDDQEEMSRNALLLFQQIPQSHNF